ncbi:MAG: malto-oligosyltrehalose trehalohydrolase [Planctomycetia bacterium]|jgi:alpha-amylase
MPKILATDLDGTLIPLPGNRANRADLETLDRLLTEHQIELVFATGRDFALVEAVIEQEGLPTPDWIIGDIGTSIYRRIKDKNYELVQAYHDHLAEISFPMDRLRERLASHPKLRIQEPERQGPFKLSYYAKPDELPVLVDELKAMLRDEEIACTLIDSLDPAADTGLIDFLPEKASKAYALDWWHRHVGVSREDIIYAGDSGNDLAAFEAGYLTIVVRNTRPPIQQIVFDTHRRRGWWKRLFYSPSSATSGVLQGCRYFGLFPMPASDPSETDGDLPTSLGATPVNFTKTFFRVWAPNQEEIHLHIEPEAGPLKKNLRQKMTRDEAGYHTAVVDAVLPGDRYGYELDHGNVRPDPVSFYQPYGVHDRSMVVDHHMFPWQDHEWSGVAKRDLVIYELHVGTFSTAGTFDGVIERLGELRELGVTAIELMPVAQSAGRWNWGYDGVNLYAPRDTYGTPDDFKRLVDSAHEMGIAVILDVVYNHLGPEGNYLAEFGPYFSEKHATPWGPAFNLDDPDTSRPVRDYLIQNALYWLREYHLDGLRLDAIHLMLDESIPRLTHELAEAVAQMKKETDRTIHLIAETNVYDEDFLNKSDGEDGGCQQGENLFDACWCDDLMHATYSVVAPDLLMTHRPYRGPKDLAEVLEYGYIYANLEDKYTRVTPTERHRLRPDGSNRFLPTLIASLQTHDVIGNHPEGKRIHQLTSKEVQRAAAALILLYPTVPILFMGEEYATETCFPFFADFTDPFVRDQVNEGRQREYSHNDWTRSPLPCNPKTFHAAVMNETGGDRQMFTWYQSLLSLRRRGLEEGWLAPENLTVETDLTRSLYMFHYREGETNRLTVAVRLTAARTDLPPLDLPLTGTLLLDSLHPTATPSPITKIQLTVPHAVIVG